MKKEKYYCENCKKELDEVELTYHGKDWLVWDDTKKDYVKDDTEEKDGQIVCSDCGEVVCDFSEF